MKKLLVVLVIAVIAYLVKVYAPVAQDYMALRYAAHKLANQTRQDGVSRKNIIGIQEEVKREADIDLYFTDIHVTNPRSGAEVEIKTRLTAHFPFIDRDLRHEVQVQAKARER